MKINQVHKDKEMENEKMRLTYRDQTKNVKLYLSWVLE